MAETVHLVLVDETQEYVDQMGRIQSADSLTLRSQSSSLVSRLEAALGDVEERETKTERERGYAWGGDAVKVVTDLLFVLSATGITAEVFQTVRAYLDLKRDEHRRKAYLEVKDGDRSVRIELEGGTAEELQAAADKHFRELIRAAADNKRISGPES
jgi:hypothetical protein